MIVGLYTRVSTESQVTGESLPEQERDGRTWAADHGHTVAAVYSDPGFSGTLPAPDRPGLADALDALAAGVIDGLVIRDLDRLARELTVQEAVLAQIWSRPDTSVFAFNGEVHRDDPDDPMRKAIRQMRGVFAELDRALIAKRLRDARRVKARKGLHANGPAPYGWRTHDGELYPVPDELRVLDRMRTLRAEGLTQTQIADELNREGVSARKGGRWSQPVVGRVLARDAARTPAQVAYQAERLRSAV